MPRRGHDDDGSESGDGVSFETLRDEGMHFMHVQHFEQAAESFTKVIINEYNYVIIMSTF